MQAAIVKKLCQKNKALFIKYSTKIRILFEIIKIKSLLKIK